MGCTGSRSLYTVSGNTVHVNVVRGEGVGNEGPYLYCLWINHGRQELLRHALLS